MAIYSFPVATGLTAAALGILFIVLTVSVVINRIRHNVAIGDGGHDDLILKVRAQGNFIENAPIFLILMLLVELTGAHPLTIAVVGPLFVLCRIAHPIGIIAFKGPNIFRGIGAIGSMLIETVLAIELALTLLPYLSRW